MQIGFQPNVYFAGGKGYGNSSLVGPKAQGIEDESRKKREERLFYKGFDPAITRPSDRVYPNTGGMSWEKFVNKTVGEKRKKSDTNDSFAFISEQASKAPEKAQASCADKKGVTSAKPERVGSQEDPENAKQRQLILEAIQRRQQEAQKRQHEANEKKASALADKAMKYVDQPCCPEPGDDCGSINQVFTKTTSGGHVVQGTFHDLGLRHSYDTRTTAKRRSNFIATQRSLENLRDNLMEKSRTDSLSDETQKKVNEALHGLYHLLEPADGN